MPRRGDGKLYITFVDVGHGDCTIIACPNGKLVLFDCGSARWGNSSLDDIRVVLVDNDKYLYDNNGYGSDSLKIEALVVSHPDRDHYDKFISLFVTENSDLENTRFEKVYHSVNLDQYALTGFNNWIGGNSGSKRKYTIANRGTVTKVVENDVTDNRPLMIVDGTNSTKGSKATCEVCILASGYEHPAHSSWSDDDKRNEASIVMRIEFGNDSIMITGDATVDTEAFMLEKYKGTGWLSADVLRVGHHGSETSSSEDFVKKVLTTGSSSIIISCKANTSFHAPRKTLMKRFRTYAANSSQHQVGYFDDLDQWQTKDIQDAVYLTGIAGSIPYTFDGT